MTLPLPDATPYDLAIHDIGEIRVFLTTASDLLHDVDIAKDCLEDHLTKIAEDNPECTAPFNSLIDTGAFEKLKSLLNTIEIEIIECENRIHLGKVASKDESDVPW